MRLMLAGTRTFGAEALSAIVGDSHDVARVWAPAGDSVEARARTLGIACAAHHTPEEIQALELDLIVMAHSHYFVSAAARRATRLGAIGYHPSALPRHRGRDAVEWTIRMKDAIAGGTVYWANDVVDGGPIAAREFVHVAPRWDASDLWRKALFPLGIRLLRGVLDDLDNGVVVEVPQDEGVATVEPSIEQPRLHRPDLIGLPPAGGYQSGLTYVTDEGGVR